MVRIVFLVGIKNRVGTIGMVVVVVVVVGVQAATTITTTDDEHKTATITSHGNEHCVIVTSYVLVQ